MKNKEKYAKEIIEVACCGYCFGMDKDTSEIISCDCIYCHNCAFDGDRNCNETKRKWAESEYIVKPVISKRDRAFLDYIKNNFVYIARDKSGRLYVYSNKPIKKSRYYDSIGGVIGSVCSVFNIKLPMVKWEDNEPWLIEDLKKLEVVEEYN